MLGRILFGIAVDAMPHRKAQLLVLCLGVATLATFGLVFSTSVAYAYVAAAFIGGFGGSIMSLQPALIIDFVGIAALPLAQGVASSIQAPSALFGAPLGGIVRQAWGSYKGTWLLAACTNALATGLALGVPGGWIDLRRCCFCCNCRAACDIRQ